MRADLRGIVEQDFQEALSFIGYVKVREDGSEWRRRQFHLFARARGKRKRILTLKLHEDLPSSLPPFHKARHSGKALTQELEKIVEAYKRRRAAK